MGKYSEVLYKTLAERYGIESKRFYDAFHNEYAIGIEALSEEIEANDELEEEQDDFGESSGSEDLTSGDFNDNFSDITLTDDNDDNTENEEEEESTKDKSIFDSMSNDGLFGTDGSGEYTGAGSWDPDAIKDDEIQTPSQCINMVKVLSEFNNKYKSNMEVILKGNKDVIDTTGNFKEHPLYESFILPANKILNVAYKDHVIVKHANNLLKMMEDSKKMSAVTGEKDNPFIYEGMQMLILELHRSLLGLLPFYVKQVSDIASVIETMKLNVVRALIEMAADFVEIENLIGSKIFYVAPVKSDITGRSEEIAQTPYAKVESINVRPIFSKMVYSGESIMNLIEIKNQKVLPEFTIVSKILRTISGLCIKSDFEKQCKTALEDAKLVLNNADEKFIDEICEKCRQEIFIPQVEAMTEVMKEESSKDINDVSSTIDTIDADPNVVKDKEDTIEPNGSILNDMGINL